MDAGDLALAGLAALAAGIVNAVAGGGTLLTFPTLLALGVPPILANATNTVGLLPGYLGGTLAQRRDLDGQRRRLAVLLPLAAVGGGLGGLLLLRTPEEVFSALVPVLLVLAVVVLALGDRVKRRVAERLAGSHGAERLLWPGIGLLLAAVYGGYFGGGLGIIVLAVLGATLVERLVRVNALKQATSLAANGAAAVVFIAAGEVLWGAAVAMLVGSVAGGYLGGHAAGRIPARHLQRLVLAIGVVVAAVYAYVELA
jgi:uncharacterized membrane protein YfcA